MSTFFPLFFHWVTISEKQHITFEGGSIVYGLAFIGKLSLFIKGYSVQKVGFLCSLTTCIEFICYVFTTCLKILVEYRNDSNKRPEHLFNFSIFTWALI